MMMVSSSELRKVTKMIAVIKARGRVHRWEMIDEARVSIGDYNKLKSYMEFKFAEQVKYDKQHEEWSYLYPSPKAAEIQVSIETATSQ